MINNTLVSVIISNYNQQDTIGYAINSVLNQSFKNIEIIIIDDLSSDNSKKIITEFQKNNQKTIFPIFNTKNEGISKSRNTGIKNARGKYISYLDGDDFYYPQKIEKEVKLLETNPSYDIAYSNFHFVDEERNILNLWNKKDSSPTGNIFLHVATRDFPEQVMYRCELVKKEIWEQINYYDEKLVIYEDWDSRIRMTKHAKAIYSNYIGSAYTLSGTGLSGQTNSYKQINIQKKILYKNRQLFRDLSKEENKQINNTILYSFSRSQIYTTRFLLKLFYIFLHIFKFPNDVKKVFRKNKTIQT